MEHQPHHHVAEGHPPAAQAPLHEKPWSTGLFDCFDDINNCCLTLWCPCVTFGQVAEILNRGALPCGMSASIYVVIAALAKFQWIYSCTYRSRMREAHGLEEGPCADCCVHLWCEPCSLCQISRELKNRGWDLTLGYRANLEKRGSLIQQAAAIPPPRQGMLR